MDEIHKEDILVACKELALREPPIGEETQKVSLMLCGPIRGWDRTFLEDLAKTYTGIKELFLDRPLRKSAVAQETTFEDFVSQVPPRGFLLMLDFIVGTSGADATFAITPSRLVYLFNADPDIYRISARQGYAKVIGFGVIG